MIADMGLSELGGEVRREDALDRPVLRALLQVIHEGTDRELVSAGSPDRYQGLGD